MSIITNQQVRRIAQELNAQNAVLSAIAGKGGAYPVENWNDVMQIVGDGIADKVFVPWEQFEIEHSRFGTMPFDIVAFNNSHKELTSDEYSMTLLLHPVCYGYQVSAQQALIACQNGLKAGTYSFTVATAYSSWAVGTYNFTLTHDIPIGGQLVLSGQANTALTSLKLRLYASPTSTTIVETIDVRSGASGTSLGDVASMTSTVEGVYINHLQRASYGSNNYAESAIRQYLNAYGYDWWKPTTMFDRPPTYISQEGFMTGLEEDFLEAVGTTCVKLQSNSLYESPDSEYKVNQVFQIYDKFYLPSQREIFGSDPSTALADGSVQYQAYVGLTNSERIKYDITNNSARGWFLRTPYVPYALYVRICNTSGGLDGYNANVGNGLVPACTIYAPSDNPTR